MFFGNKKHVNPVEYYFEWYLILSPGRFLLISVKIEGSRNVLLNAGNKEREKHFCFE